MFLMGLALLTAVSSLKVFGDAWRTGCFEQQFEEIPTSFFPVPGRGFPRIFWYMEVLVGQIKDKWWILHCHV